MSINVSAYLIQKSRQYASQVLARNSMCYIEPLTAGTVLRQSWKTQVVAQMQNISELFPVEVDLLLL